MLSEAGHMKMRMMCAALLLILFCSCGCIAATSSVMIATTTFQGTAEEIPATLLTPEGAGPFPALVMMHDCSGAAARWAQQLAQRAPMPMRLAAAVRRRAAMPRPGRTASPR